MFLSSNRLLWEKGCERYMKTPFSYRLEERKRENFIKMMMVFFVSTTCICILEAILGTIFWKNRVLNYGELFSPPLFGLITVVLKWIAGIDSKYEMSVTEVVVRQVIHLVLIECTVFGLNIISGTKFSVGQSIILMVAIALTYTIVYVVIWLNDMRSAMLFNEQLKKFQKEKAVKLQE